MISARALGIYVYLYLSGSQINAEALSEVFKEGREAMQSALGELRKAGVLETKKERVGGRIITYSRLTTPDYWNPETRFLFLKIQRNKELLRNSNFYKSNAFYPAKPGEEEKFIKVNFEGGTMSDFPEAYDPDDLDEARRRRDKAKFDEKQEQKSRQYEAGLAKRSLDPAKWSVQDSVYEFANRMLSLWHVLPWHIGSSRFKIALANARSTYGTTGYEESLMFDLFFKQVSHNKNINDPEIIWKMFIKQFGSLLASVKQSDVTDDKVEKASLEAIKSQDRLKRIAEGEGL